MLYTPPISTVKSTLVWNAAPCSVVGVYGRSSETLVNLCQATWNRSQVGGTLPSYRRENLKSHTVLFIQALQC